MTVILALNFLIAIVSQSYESIMDRQEEAIILSKSELNMEYTRQVDPNSGMDVEMIVLATKLGRDRKSKDGQWSGLSQNIKDDVRASRKAARSELQRLNQSLKVQVSEETRSIRDDICGLQGDLMEIKQMLNVRLLPQDSFVSSKSEETRQMRSGTARSLQTIKEIKEVRNSPEPLAE